jgi:hypothetical protein
MSTPNTALLIDLAALLAPDGCKLELHPAQPKRDGNLYYSATVTDYFEESATFESTDLGALFAKVIEWYGSPPDGGSHVGTFGPESESPSYRAAMIDAGRGRLLK